MGVSRFAVQGGGRATVACGRSGPAGADPRYRRRVTDPGRVETDEGDEAARAGTPPVPSRAPAPLPWARLLALATLGTVLAVAIVFADLHRTRDTNGGLIHTGPQGPAAALMAHDFPDEPQFTYGEHDGPMFYAVARDPWRLDVAAESLDRPRYRLQHPLFSWLAWLAHPTGGGGDGLLAAMVVVGVGALLLGGVATGALSHTWRGPVWPAALFPLLPGATMSLRITVADALAVALLVAALTSSVRGRAGWALVLATAAVLTKEPMVLGLVGLAAWRRDRQGVALVAVPAAVAATWALVLRVQVESHGGEVIEFGAPFRGLTEAVGHWSGGGDRYAMVAVVASLGAAGVALARHRLDHPLSVAVALHLGFVVLLTKTVLGLERNGTRMTLPLLVLAVVVLVTPSAAARPAAGPDRGVTVGRYHRLLHGTRAPESR